MQFFFRNRTFFIILGLIIYFIAPCSFAKKHRYRSHAVIENSYAGCAVIGPNNIVSEINHIVAAINPNLNVGIHIKSMQYGDTLYTKNNARLFVPASILKIFTAESALLFLGSNYKFSTRFVTNALNINDGVIHGNLYLVHSGDPSLTSVDLEDMMRSLQAKHIRQINGNIYIDNSAYDQKIYAPGWIWNDRRFCYAAPISASIINHNCLSFRISPARTIGHYANIVENTGSIIQNNVITKPASNRSCYIRLGTDIHNLLVVSGCMPKGRYAQGISSVVTDVMYYNRLLLAKLFNRYGIVINGNITAGVAPKNATMVTAHNSEPLYKLITEMLKKSDNIIAGSVFKKMGEIYTKQPGSWENGRTAVTQILANQIGVDTQQINITDGSGLSRLNFISPSQMMHVLDFAYHNPNTNYDFISALPVAGVDGTLKNRLHNVAWKIRAKTGTMSGVVALAGYAMNKEKEPIAFVIIINGRTGLGWKYKAMEDHIVTVLTRYKRFA